MLRTNFSDKKSIRRKFWRDLLDMVSIRRKPIHWGTVYDSQTKQPIDPAVVELLDYLTGEMRQTAITDLWGKYGFLARQGDYLIRVSRSNYTFPSKQVPGRRDGIYKDMYHGEQISIRSSWGFISPSIPLDPMGADFNQQAKQEFAKIHPGRENLARWIFQIFFWGGFAVSAGFFFLREQSLAETAVFVFFVLLLGLRLLLRPSPVTGRIVSAKTGEPLGFMDLELYMPERPGTVIAKVRTVPDGRFFLKSPPGNYGLKITDPAKGHMVAEGTATLGVDGILNSEIRL